MTGTIGPKRYRILFFGAFAPHLAKIDAAAVLKQQLDVPDDQLATCLSGRKVALRHDLDEQAARQWFQRLSYAGLEVIVEPPLPALGLPAEAAPASAQTPAAQPAPMTERPQHARPPWRLAVTGIIGLALVVVGVIGWQRLLAPRVEQWRMSRSIESAVSALASVEAEINRFAERTGFLPNHALDMGRQQDSLLQTAEIDSLRLGQSGQLILTFSDATAALDGVTLILSPAHADDDQGFRWHCAGGTLPQAQWPDRCQQRILRDLDTAPGPRLSDLPEMAGIDRMALPTPSLAAMEAADPTTRVLATIIEDTMDMRLKALRHYMETLAWPASNDAVGLPPGHKLAGKHMRHLRFIEDGRIEVRFDDSLPSLAGHRFWLRPTMPGQWVCESTLADDQLPVTCKTPIK